MEHHELGIVLEMINLWVLTKAFPQWYDNNKRQTKILISSNQAGRIVLHHCIKEGILIEHLDWRAMIQGAKPFGSYDTLLYRGVILSLTLWRLNMWSWTWLVTVQGNLCCFGGWICRRGRKTVIISRGPVAWRILRGMSSTSWKNLTFLSMVSLGTEIFLCSSLVLGTV